MRIQGTLIICAAMLAMPASRAFAQQDSDRGYHDQNDRDVRRHFTDHDRRVLNDWYRDHAEQFQSRDEHWNSEDLDRRLQPGSQMDDEMRRWSRPVSDDLLNRLDPLPRGWEYRRIGYNICIVDRDSSIRDVYRFERGSDRDGDRGRFTERDRDAIRDWNRDHQNAVNQLLGAVGVRVDNADLDHRLQVGNRVDEDLQSSARPAPGDLLQRLSPLPRDWRYIVIGDRLLIVDRDWRIRDAARFSH